MKKRYLLSILLLSLIIMPAVLAVEIDLSKDSYQPGELLQAEITGNFLSFEPENVLLYRGEMVHSTPVISDLTNQNNIYYFFAILPYEQGNYSIRIEDAEYTKAGDIIDEIVIKNFTIKSSNDSALSINPGFIITSEDFTIDVKSIYGNLDTTAELKGGESKSLFLVEDAEETISFSIEGITKSTNITIEDYTIPIFIIEKVTPPEPVIPENKTELIFIPSALSGKVTATYPFKIFIANSGTENVRGIEISTESNLTLANIEIGLLEPGKQHEITVIIAEDLKKGQMLEGTIIATFEDQEITLPFSFEITEDEKEVEVISETPSLSSCEELEGEKCNGEEECSIDTELSLDGPCCMGTCDKIKTSNTTTIIGYSIIGLIILIVVVFYFKGKKKLRPKSTEQILKEKGNKFQDRMKGKEISGRLER